MKKILIVLAAVIMAAPAVLGQDSIEAKAAADRNSVKLGDSIVYTISVKRSGSGGSSPEVSPPSFDGFRVSGTSSQNSVSIINGAATIVTELQYGLIAVKSGQVTIPPAKIRVMNPATGQPDTIETKPVVINVSGGRGQAAAQQQPTATPTTEPDIKEIRMNLAFRFSDLIPYIVLAVAFIIAVVVAWKMIFAKKPPAPASREEKGYKEEALGMLAKAAGYLNAGDMKGYYSAIYEAVRHFLSGHLGESYAELTTQEIMKKIKGKLSEGKAARVSEFMSDCDIVKFADFKPSAAEAEAAGKKAEEIVEKT